MNQFAIALVGGIMLAISLGLLYMTVVEKLGWSDNNILLGMVTLVTGIVLLAIAPHS